MVWHAKTQCLSSGSPVQTRSANEDTLTDPVQLPPLPVNRSMMFGYNGVNKREYKMNACNNPSVVAVEKKKKRRKKKKKKTLDAQLT